MVYLGCNLSYTPKGEVVKVGEKLRNEIVKAGMSYAEFGRRMNTSRSHVSLLVRRERFFPKTIGKISSTLGIDPSEFFVCQE
jgi:transcriptional regulator with XRE-family HTH domain